MSEKRELARGGEMSAQKEPFEHPIFDWVTLGAIFVGFAVGFSSLITHGTSREVLIAIGSGIIGVDALVGYFVTSYWGSKEDASYADRKEEQIMPNEVVQALLQAATSCEGSEWLPQAERHLAAEAFRRAAEMVSPYLVRLEAELTEKRSECQRLEEEKRALQTRLDNVTQGYTALVKSCQMSP
jgi:hypothetical protein